MEPPQVLRVCAKVNGKLAVWEVVTDSIRQAIEEVKSVEQIKSSVLVQIK